MAARKKKAEEDVTERLVWEGITIDARYRPHYCGGTHLELHVIDPPRAPLPVTDTGYRSHFHKLGDVEAAGGPAAYTTAWLDHEAKDRKWKRQQVTGQQLSLF